MIIKFKLFESYLKGNKQPLIHQTNNLYYIIDSDILKTSVAADENVVISFTRSLYFTDASTDSRLLLNADKLKNDGYNIYPFDEVGYALSKGANNMDIPTKNRNKIKKKLSGYTKVNPYQDFRKIINNIGIEYDDMALENEYEERCDTNITDLGKYLIAIDIDLKIINHKILNKLDKYLNKYPHIELVEYNQKNLWDRRNILDIKKLLNQFI